MDEVGDRCAKSDRIDVSRAARATKKIKIISSILPKTSVKRNSRRGKKKSYNILPLSRSCLQESIPGPAEKIHGFSFAYKFCLAKFSSDLKSTE